MASRRSLRKAIFDSPSGWRSADATGAIPMVIRRGRGYVACPGGTGTLVELAVVWEMLNKGAMSNKPLVVLTAGKSADASQLPAGFPKKEFDDFHEVWVNDLQVKESHLSTRGKRIMVPDRTHMIPFERPDTIVAAIHEVWAATNADKAGRASEPATPATH